MAKGCSEDLPFTPPFLHHGLNLLASLLWCEGQVSLGGILGDELLCKLLEGEGPTVKPGAEANGTNHWIDLWGGSS